jgi:hypothetical protein
MYLILIRLQICRLILILHRFMPLTLYPSGTLILYEYRFRFTLRYALFLSTPTNKQSLHIMFALQLWLLAFSAVSYHRFAISTLHFFDFARMFFIISFFPFYRFCTFTLIHFDTFFTFVSYGNFYVFRAASNSIFMDLICKITKCFLLYIRPPTDW